jgi:hypothetical protein
VATDLARALGLPANADPPPDSLPTILARSANRVPDPRVRCGRNILLTICAASQFVNADAHVDRTPEFPIPLIKSFSHGLRDNLLELVRCLKRWPTDELWT